MRRWRQSLLSLGTSLLTSSLAALLRRASEATEPTTGAGQRANRDGRGEHGGRLRALAVDFISDVLAETYRKIRASQDYGHRRR